MKNTGILIPLLTTLFIGLKLTGHIGWSWLWVLSPIWGPPALFLLIFGLLCGLHGVLWTFEMLIELLIGDGNE